MILGTDPLASPFGAFAETIREKNPEATIVSNGICYLRPWAMLGDEFHAGLSFLHAYWEFKQYFPYLLPEEIERVHYVTNHPLEFALIDKVIAYLDLTDTPPDLVKGLPGAEGQRRRADQASRGRGTSNA